MPRPGQFGNDTWLNDSWSYTGNTGVWGQMTVDEEAGLVYMPVEMPTNDYYGGHRPGNNLFGSSIVAADLRTGQRKWHYQFIHHDIWDWDTPVRADSRGPHGQRPADQGRRPADQARLGVRVRSPDRRARLADRRAPGREGRRAGRVVCADAAVPDEAAGVRASGRVDRRSDRLHARAARGGGQAGVALQDRSDLHAARVEQVGGSARDAHAAPGHRRSQLAGRLARSRDEHALHLLEHQRHCARAGARRSEAQQRHEPGPGDSARDPNAPPPAAGARAAVAAKAVVE